MDQIEDKDNPACERLTINKDGEFCHEGVRITHPGTIAMLFNHLDLDRNGTYFVRVGREWAAVEVEDAPYVVKAVRERADGLVLILSDGRSERLGPDELEINEENVLYCRVKDRRFPARFSRPAYYQIATFIEPAEEGTFCLSFAGRKIPIRPRGGSGC